jgi:hypothetical protein
MSAEVVTDTAVEDALCCSVCADGAPLVRRRRCPRCGRRLVPLFPIDSRPIPRPTRAKPGTPAKRRVLRRRARRGEQLFHVLDAPADRELQGLGPLGRTSRRLPDPRGPEARREG